MENEEIMAAPAQESITENQTPEVGMPDPSEETEEISDTIYDISESQQPSPAETELREMLEEVGAETLLQIIKDNRNAAIRQIIKEVEESRDRTIPSGASAAHTCSSIFDLASLA